MLLPDPRYRLWTNAEAESKGTVQVKSFDDRFGGAHSQNRIGYSDLVIAIPSDEAHVPLIQASWSWRQVR